MKTLLNRLRESSDHLERESATKVDTLFPNYEVMESAYLIKIRNEDGNWRYDTSPQLEEIGMSHYAILKSFNYINISRPQISVGDSNQRYKNIYFHFGLIFDTVENMARNIVLTGSQLRIREFKNKVKKSNKDLLAEFQKYVETRYEKAFSDMIKYGRPIFYHPQYPINFISILITEKDFKTEYRNFEKSIRDYRNFYIHKPAMDIAINKETSQLFALKKEYINIDEYRYWSYIRKSIEVQLNPHHFDNPISIVEEDLNRCLSLLNVIYGYFLKEMEGISKAVGYEALLRNFDRDSYDFQEHQS